MKGIDDVNYEDLINERVAKRNEILARRFDLDGENKMMSTTISELDRGYVVEMGCSKFAFSTKEELIKALLCYIDNPNEARVKWRKGEFFNNL